ncbi:MAG TPA: phage holin family protein [Steroidobacteraceae bacterium]|jgi:uncharacterized membrane protein YqjE|nr:phage holin family protein [Steroidobacteraceae bacterium]
MTELPGESQQSRISGFLDSVGQLFITALEMVQTRLELVFTELQEGLEALVGQVLWLLSALLAAGLGLLFGGLALIFVFWDSHRVLVAVLLMCMFLLLAAVATGVMVAKLRMQRSLFATTLTELAKDRAILKAPP